MKYILLASMSFLAACNVRGPDMPKLHRMLYRTIEAPKEECVNGGAVMLSGIDSNANDYLDDVEVTKVEYLCVPELTQN